MTPTCIRSSHLLMQTQWQHGMTVILTSIGSEDFYSTILQEIPPRKDGFDVIQRPLAVKAVHIYKNLQRTTKLIRQWVTLHTHNIASHYITSPYLFTFIYLFIYLFTNFTKSDREFQFQKKTSTGFPKIIPH